MKAFVICAGNIPQEDASIICESLDSTVVEAVITTPQDLQIDVLAPGDVVVCSPFEGAFFDALLEQVIDRSIRIIGPPIATSRDWATLDQLPPVIYGLAPVFTSGEQKLVVFVDTTDASMEELHLAFRYLQWMGATITATFEEALIIFAQPLSKVSEAARRSSSGQKVYPLESIFSSWKTYMSTQGVSFPKLQEVLPLAGCKICLSLTGLSATLHKQFSRWVEELGADSAPALSPNVTHFVTKDVTESAKAYEVGAIPVKHTWVMRCWSTGVWMDERDHLVQATTSTCPSTSTSVAMIEAADLEPGTPTRFALETSLPNKVMSMLSASVATPISPRDRATTLATDSPASETRKRKHSNYVVSTRGFDVADAELGAELPTAKTPKKESESACSVTTASTQKAPTPPVKDDKFASQPTEQAPSRLDEKRRNSVQELRDCEANLHETMKIIREVFLQPIKQEKRLEVGYQNRIFRNTDAIQALSASVSADLQQLLDKWNEGPAVVSSVFTTQRMADFEKYYKLIATQAEDVRSALDDAIMKNKPFAAFVRHQESDRRCRRRLLKEMLYEPVQHIMRYGLHLKRISDSTPENHPDAVPLQQLIERFRTIVANTNETKRAHEGMVNFQLMLHMIENLPPHVISSSRSFVTMEEVMSCMNRREPMALILLSDQLIVVRGQSKRSEWRQTLTFGRHRRKDYQFVMAHQLKSTSIHDVMEARTVDGVILDQCVCVRYNPMDSLPQPSTDKLDVKASSRARRRYDRHEYFRFSDEERKQAFLKAARETMRNKFGYLTEEMQGDEDQLRSVQDIELSSRQRRTFGDDDAEDDRCEGDESILATPPPFVASDMDTTVDRSGRSSFVFSSTRSRSQTITQSDVKSGRRGFRGRNISSASVNLVQQPRLFAGVSSSDISTPLHSSIKQKHENSVRSSCKRLMDKTKSFFTGKSSKSKETTSMNPLQEQNRQADNCASAKKSTHLSSSSAFLQQMETPRK
eukprot:m.144397 g.144397  ORF g.144397 m.144397 type:complete len:986 (+) comp16041_c0_seq8:381-3338(+)